MRVFLDENVDPGLAALLTPHEVQSVRSRGWLGVTNGELIRRIEEEHDILISHDQGLVHQQRWEGRHLSLLVIAAASTRLQDYEDSIERILAALADIRPGMAVRIEVASS